MSDQDLLAVAARARKAQEAVNALGAGKPQPVADEPPTEKEIADLIEPEDNHA